MPGLDPNSRFGAPQFDLLHEGLVLAGADTAPVGGVAPGEHGADRYVWFSAGEAGPMPPTAAVPSPDPDFRWPVVHYVSFDLDGAYNGELSTRFRLIALARPSVLPRMFEIVQEGIDPPVLPQHRETFEWARERALPQATEVEGRVVGPSRRQNEIFRRIVRDWLQIQSADG